MEISEKLQILNNNFCELKVKKIDDIGYLPIVREIESILDKDPNNVGALQLEILVKTSYKVIPWDDVERLCDRLLKIDPNNKVAKRAKDKVVLKEEKRKPIEIDFSLIFMLIVAIVCAIYLYKNWVF